MSVGLRPIRDNWTSRGKPLHRNYLEQFMQQCSTDIRGHCLEFQEDAYTTVFGRSNVAKLDIIHKGDDNPSATITADLTEANALESNVFDCVICTYTLHLVTHPERVVAELYRMLRPDGVLLISVPDITLCCAVYHEFWRFTAEGLRLLLERSFEGPNVTVKSFGNSLTAAGELRGLVAENFTKSELNTHDPTFSLLHCARAVK